MIERVVLFVSFLFLPMKISLVVALIYVAVKIYRLDREKGLNPFEDDDRKPRRDYVIDHTKRDAVIKQSFDMAKVPEGVDAIVIGSGIGGLSAAAILSKAGKKVLVLEQHDQAGGCCHTFVDKGYEFDVGIHYIGKMYEGSLDKVLIDQISDGQLEWASLGDVFDEISIGKSAEDCKRYPVYASRDAWKESLLKAFPEETKAIEEYFELLKNSGGFGTAFGLLKMIPLWLAKIVIKTGIIHMINNTWSGNYRKNTLDVLEKLTSNKTLQTIFCYCWGDYGSPPAQSQFQSHVSLINYFLKSGGYYPVGGASEIAFNVIPVIERSGGKVLVRASVDEILVNNGKAVGVKVSKGPETHEIRAPIVISSAGVYNTFLKLLPKPVAQKSYFYNDIATKLKPAVAAMNVFVGLNASAEELGLPKHNTWAFVSEDSALLPEEKYFDLDVSKAMETDAPLLFFGFPSNKDPNWKKHRGRENKGTCTIVGLANWKWFQKFEKTQLKKRGDEYEEIKSAIGDRMIEQVCNLYPSVRHHIDFVEIGSPCSNLYYLGQPHGEIYGLDHDLKRMDPWVTAQLRPQTDIPGLFLTGQDVMTGGFAGAMYAGLISAGAVLNRNVMSDLSSLAERLKKFD